MDLQSITDLVQIKRLAREFGGFENRFVVVGEMKQKTGVGVGIALVELAARGAN